MIDVRRREAFQKDTKTIAGALRRDPDRVSSWSRELPSAGKVVVFCAHGHEVSQGVAKALNEQGREVAYLEGGLADWQAGDRATDSKPAAASTRWVTRERPKIDRIACPWLIARFVDKDAEFLYVPTKEVRDVAKARDAIPYDIPDVHFSHEETRHGDVRRALRVVQARPGRAAHVESGGIRLSRPRVRRSGQ